MPVCSVTGCDNRHVAKGLCGDATWNPVTGCTKVSQGCKHCYAERDWQRLQHLPRFKGRAFTDVVCHPERLDQPIRWAKPRRIFVNSMSDLFHEEVPTGFIDEVFAVMALATQHTFQVLTKRPERMRDYMLDPAMNNRFGMARARIFYAHSVCDCDVWMSGQQFRPLPNVWLGVSVEDQATANDRIPLLLQTPAAVRWISAEPLLGPIDLEMMRVASDLGEGQPYLSPLRGYVSDGHGDTCNVDRIDWVVVGGESGPKARPMHPQWVRDLRRQCDAAGVAFLLKQNGEFASVSEAEGFGAHFTFPDGATVRRVGKRRADQSKALAALRAFAQAVMDCWPDGWGIEGDDLQRIATEHGMLRPEIRHDPCGDSCRCADHVLQKEWIDGVVCYRKTSLLTGEDA